uniref:Uncharacterized protein n=1 Tax=Anguilla anguilla TaxID=7936 RepID=A0A0E9S0I5_ANGAN
MLFRNEDTDITLLLDSNGKQPYVATWTA